MQEYKLGRPSEVHLRDERCVKISLFNVEERDYLGNVGVDRSLALRKDLKGIYGTVD